MVDRHKIGRNAKRKGNAFESSTAQKFTKWYNLTASKPLEKAFYRVPVSGALTWASSMNVDGDVTADPTIQFNYLIECKKVEGWTVENILRGNMYFPAWIAQSVREGENISKVPLLIFSRKRVDPMVSAPYNHKLANLLDPYIIKTITYKSETTGKKDCMKTITFMLDDFMKIPFDTANNLYDGIDWTKQVTKSKTKSKSNAKVKKPNKVADDILNGLNNL